MNIDMMGKEVQVGDFVAVPDGNLTMIFGIVTKLNPKTIKVKKVGTDYIKQIPNKHFVKLDQSDSLIKALSSI